jgi:nucleotide-binding universal stress UspA family protein
MLKKILVAVDLSTNNEKIVSEAILVAKAIGAKLMLIHVLSEDEDSHPPYPLITEMGYYPLNNIIFEDYETYEKKGLALLRSYTNRATAEGLETEFTQTVGNPGKMICDMAQNWEADLIVIGRRGHSGWNELVLGSVSNYVLHHARCSVFIVQGQPQLESGRILNPIGATIASSSIHEK